MYLLDTNTVIYFFKGEGGVAERLLATAPSQVAMSTVTVFELLVGVAKSSASLRRRKQVETLVSSVRILPFSDAESRAAAVVRAELERAGTPIGPLDNLIAGTARAHAATLVTRNVNEFRRVSELRVESWYGAGAEDPR